ncbi:thiazole tautomerase TenI [Alkalihalobacillus sp. AL-G]|uniref:thiazole tautomerase TenI n=1 Tax=Alkalihalobacillus sp. AL-G TaxID=2926399 RepID=UPI00272C91DF|nr:thiazole tautomerase TenI [Alkalihalobacillus sp. AL-G]WLD93893.1 thiazole tautomerase TenI [Alkalihalobacillus sp. AL-G]
MELHAISTGKQSVEEFVEIASGIHPYIDAIHIREKQRTAKEIIAIIEKLMSRQVPLQKIIVNDRVDVAFATGTRGVQLAHHSIDVGTVRRTFPGLAIGCSIHSPGELEKAEQDGADYLIFGHIFTTESKPGLAPRGLTNLQTIAQASKLPVIAIGGIHPDNVEQVLDAGASGIAVMSGIFEASDPLKAAYDYYSRVKGRDSPQ